MLFPLCSTELKSSTEFLILFTFNQDFRQLKWWLMGMIMGPLIVFGFCGNLMSITVLLRRKMRCEAFNQLLASLCVIDTIFILCNSMSCAYALRINSRKYGVFFAWLISRVLANVYPIISTLDVLFGQSLTFLKDS